MSICLYHLSFSYLLTIPYLLFFFDFLSSYLLLVTFSLISLLPLRFSSLLILSPLLTFSISPHSPYLNHPTLLSISSHSLQRAAVNNYNQYITDIPTSFYNTTGRVYPDISAIGHNFVVILDEEISPIDGTSASAPVIAGLITLLNDARLNAGKGPLGFLNPWLYGLSSDHFNGERVVMRGE